MLNVAITDKKEKTITLHEKCPYSEFFWSVFSPNMGKYGPEKLRIRTLFTQCKLDKSYVKQGVFSDKVIPDIDFTDEAVTQRDVSQFKL